VQVSAQDARKNIETLLHYFMPEENEGSRVDACSDYVQA